MLNEFESRILEEARRTVATIEGVPYSGLDKILLELRTSDRPDDFRLKLKLIQEVLEKEHAWREQSVKDLIAYKEYWGPIFRERRLLGRRLPHDVYPDPDDIEILSTTRFHFKGPVTAEENEHWQEIRRFRDMCARFADEIIESAGLFRPLEQDRQSYLKLRRQYYRFSRHFPKELGKKYPYRFPAFKPPKEPPDWYSPYDEWQDPETGEWLTNNPEAALR